MFLELTTSDYIDKEKYSTKILVNINHIKLIENADNDPNVLIVFAQPQPLNKEGGYTDHVYVDEGYDEILERIEKMTEVSK